MEARAEKSKVVLGVGLLEPDTPSSAVSGTKGLPGRGGGHCPLAPF